MSTSLWSRRFSEFSCTSLQLRQFRPNKWVESLLSKHESSSKTSATKTEREKNACVKDSKGKVKAVNNEELKKMESEMKKWKGF